MLLDCVHTLTVKEGLVSSLFTAGLVGGFTHCSGMCGPFVLAQQEENPSVNILQRLQHAALLPYHLGRMTTYVFLAVLFSAAFQFIFNHDFLKAAMTALFLVTAATMFLSSAVPALHKLMPWLVKIRLPVSMRTLNRGITPLMRYSHAGKKYLLGVLLGFLPCGLVMAALLAAVTAPTITTAALAMASFAFGTFPALFLVGGGGQIVKKLWPQHAQLITLLLSASSGALLLILAGKILLS